MFDPNNDVEITLKASSRVDEIIAGMGSAWDNLTYLE